MGNTFQELAVAPLQQEFDGCYDGDSTGLWVFAHSSVAHTPYFDFDHKEVAELQGWHRAFCIESQVYRGSQEVPGLVLGLVPGGVCQGVAFHIPPRDMAAVDEIDTREQVGGVFKRRTFTVTLQGGHQLQDCLTFVADPEHHQYCGEVDDVAAVVEKIRSAAGRHGSNASYVIETMQALSSAGIRDVHLDLVSSLLVARGNISDHAMDHAQQAAVAVTGDAEVGVD